MPPNLGGFFMVRSYYPSECHADYFDFERIEALKPAIEACGISTLSQSPMLGFHKQMDNQIGRASCRESEEIRVDGVAGRTARNGGRIVQIRLFFFSSRRRHTRSVSAFLLNRSSDLEAFLWFVLITLLNVTLIILTLSVSRLLNLLLRLVAFLLFLNPQCLASISRWITASSSWKRFCLFVCRALSSIMVICMLTAIRLLLTFVMSLYLLLRS